MTIFIISSIFIQITTKSHDQNQITLNKTSTNQMFDILLQTRTNKYCGGALGEDPKHQETQTVKVPCFNWPQMTKCYK